MFSGKTRRLLELVRVEPPATVAVFKHARDVRYSQDRVVSHDRDSVPAVTVSGAEEIPVLVGEGVRLVAVDEGHFFDEALPAVCEMLSRRGISVVVTGLDRTSWGRPFAVMERLRAMAEELCVTAGTCGRCGQAARFTQRLTPIVDGNIVGGPEAFEPRCAECWSPPPEAPLD
jgi:thymidine kinase